MRRSGNQCLQPYKLSNLLFVSELLALMAVKGKLPVFSMTYKRWTLVVVSYGSNVFVAFFRNPTTATLKFVPLVRFAAFQ